MSGRREERREVVEERRVEGGQQQQQEQYHEQQQNTSFVHTEVRAPMVNLPPPLISTGSGELLFPPDTIFPSISIFF